MASPTHRVHVKVTSTDPPHDETITFTNDSTSEEIRSVLLAAADIGDVGAEDVVLRLRSAGGALVPVSVEGLTANGDNYTLEVRKHKHVNYETLQPVLDDQVNFTNPQAVSNVHTTLRSIESQLNILRLSLPPQPPKHPVKRVPRADPLYEKGPKYILTDETREYLKKANFDPWQWEENEMIALLEAMFQDFGCMEEYKIEISTLRRFLQAVKENYNPNYFHNFRHCFCVTQMMYAILHTTKVTQKLKPVDKIVLLLACLGHDLDHPGYNNAYQVNARTDLAIIYNDVSPLEMHHCAVLFTILRDRETNILQNVADPVYREIRKGVIKCILSTDLARHGELMAQFKKFAEDGFNYDDNEHVLCLLQMIVKCADVSNEVRPPDVAEPWVDCLLAEFFEQADREKAEGLPYAPFMDRDKVTKASAQTGFIGFVMIPLYELLARVLPDMEPIIGPVRQALATYKELEQKEKEKIIEAGTQTISK
ncbi:High affinity cAMP-specific and IBMX-insensitive 3',5'-cyclic phosphodiesterase 9A [Gaertneriomyces sp. JEL0708]|nr:High affinity cAMP-specific and IBMX-insensitive 3',5'-cyclic phosphodiesterase 9A [Gaertneriomyces sp. JEL0708]